MSLSTYAAFIFSNGFSSLNYAHKHPQYIRGSMFLLILFLKIYTVARVTILATFFVYVSQIDFVLDPFFLLSFFSRFSSLVSTCICAASIIARSRRLRTPTIGTSATSSSSLNMIRKFMSEYTNGLMEKRKGVSTSVFV